MNIPSHFIRWIGHCKEWGRTGRRKVGGIGEGRGILTGRGVLLIGWEAGEIARNHATVNTLVLIFRNRKRSKGRKSTKKEREPGKQGTEGGRLDPVPHHVSKGIKLFTLELMSPSFGAPYLLNRLARH